MQFRIKHSNIKKSLQVACCAQLRWMEVFIPLYDAEYLYRFLNAKLLIGDD
jgi:hypothetical protein